EHAAGGDGGQGAEEGLEAISVHGAPSCGVSREVRQAPGGGRMAAPPTAPSCAPVTDLSRAKTTHFSHRYRPDRIWSDHGARGDGTQDPHRERPRHTRPGPTHGDRRMRRRQGLVRKRTGAVATAEVRRGTALPQAPAPS